ncbi:MAG: glutamine-hydrolyzing carbamoyl-phosphate synthase small subunit [Bdellovibrionales bacterium]|nr:glutamine-hydrolyzing carbamoyl-phosphate synthase small subunit [Bdellovibrionales bacterium]
MTALMPVPVTITLEKGASFSGLGWGDFSKPRASEFVFCTAMSGIEESLTDPSFAEQTLVSTASHVGNTGYTGDDVESSRIWAEGLVCRHLEEIPSNWRAKSSLAAWITGEGRYIVSNIDTRALTILLREQGSQRGIVTAQGSMTTPQAREYIVKHVPDMNGLDLTGRVSCTERYTYTADAQTYWPMGREVTPKARPREKATFRPTVAVWDFGVKRNTLRILNAMGADVVVMPANSKAEDILAAGKDAILLSNGPGDPAAATHIVGELKKVLGRKPVYAICLGHQLVALAAGCQTYKMKFGHRGIHHPVVELDRSGRAKRTWITSQNHGFAVDASKLPAQARVSFLHADDNSVEGLSFPEWNCETVQFHPEAGPGPFDAGALLKKFLSEVGSRGHS